ncbi:MAG: hypothetical protein WDN49_16560 [Acetobacteraceae bacterium]
MITQDGRDPKLKPIARDILARQTRGQADFRRWPPLRLARS